MTTIIEQNRDNLIELCRKYHVAALDVFGSAACDEFEKETRDSCRVLRAAYRVI